MKFIQLVIQEMKHQIKSITFLIFCVFVLLFHMTQFVGDMKNNVGVPIHPLEGLRSGGNIIYYGGHYDDHPPALRTKMDVLKELVSQDISHKSTLYVVNRPTDIIGITDEQLDTLKQIEANLKNQDVAEQIYQENLLALGHTLGEETIYNDTSITQFATRLEAYNDYQTRMVEIRGKQKMSGAYGRLFADYIGIAVGFFAVFISAFSLIKDRKYKAHEMIYTRSISSVQYVLSKYIGNVLLMLGVILVIATYTTIDFAITYGSIDYFAFYKYTFAWILPTIMMVTSIAYLVQILFTNGVAPIVAIFAYWFYSMPFSSNQYHVSRYIIRYNSLSTIAEYKQVADAIMTNRLYILGASLVIIIVSMWIFEKKRGRICG